MKIYNRITEKRKSRNLVSKICGMLDYDIFFEGKKILHLNDSRDFKIFKMILQKHKYKRTNNEL